MGTKAELTYEFGPNMEPICPHKSLERIARQMVSRAAEYLAAHPHALIDYRGIRGQAGVVKEKMYKPTTREAALLSAFAKSGVDNFSGIAIDPDTALEVAHHFAVPHFIAIADLGWFGYVAQSTQRQARAEFEQRKARKRDRPKPAIEIA